MFWDSKREYDMGNIELLMIIGHLDQYISALVAVLVNNFLAKLSFFEKCA